jgi:hypothetical protein
MPPVNSGLLYDEQGRVLTVKRTLGNPAAAGNTEIVGAVAGSKIRVLAVTAIASAAVNMKFQTNVTDISPLWPLAANGGLVQPHNDHGWEETVAGDPLNVNLSGNVAVAVQITYVRILVP